MTYMRSELLKDTTVMFVNPDWIISSHDVFMVNEIVNLTFGVIHNTPNILGVVGN